MNRKLKTLAEWQVLQHKMVLMENRQVEQDKAIQWMKQEETHKVLAKLKRRNEKLRRRLKCSKEFSRRQKKLHRQALEMIEKLENMKKNKKMKDYYREKSNARALCSEIRKLLRESEAVIARSRE